MIADGIYGLDANVQDTDADPDELIALAGTFGLAAPDDRRAERISADGKLLFNAPVPGPWLFIDLPPGRYRIDAAHRGKPQTRTTQIHPNDRHQLLFYFDDPADVSPEWEKPFKDNPYGK